MFARRKGGLGGGVENQRDLNVQTARYKNSYGGLKYSIGNIVNNIVIIMCGFGWVLDLYG